MLNDKNSYKNRNLSEVFKELEQARYESMVEQTRAKHTSQKKSDYFNKESYTEQASLRN